MAGPWTQTVAALSLLRDKGLGIAGPSFLIAIERFHGLCSTWNLSAKLMSAGDLDSHFDSHVADSLALLPWVERLTRNGDAFVVDIGSGAGFPAIPLILAGANAKFVLIERSDKKAAFLRQALRQLSLRNTVVDCGVFPRTRMPEGRRVFTARATEHPKSVDSEILRILRDGDCYLAQREIDQSERSAGAHALTINDDFDRLGLRRGQLTAYCHESVLREFHVEPEAWGD